MQKVINNMISILIVVTICIVTFGITYAWFVSLKSIDVNELSSGKLEIIYDNGQDVTGTLRPSTSKENGLVATVKIRRTTDSVLGLGTITLNVIDIAPELSISGLKWELYKDSDTLPISNGTFDGVTSDSQIKLISDYELLTSDTVFTIYIWLNGEEVGNSVMNKSFSAYINASARSKPVDID